MAVSRLEFGDSLAELLVDGVMGSPTSVPAGDLRTA
jgi:hypothetical protein